MKKITAIFICVFMLLTANGAEPAADNAADMAVGAWTADPRYITFGSYNGHDLVWRVLEVSTTDADNPGNKTALLLLDDVLRDGSGETELRQFHSFDDNDWNGSDVKAFLNGQFLDAFTADQQAGIVTSNYVYGVRGEGNDTAGSSKVFLLSVDEAMNSKYFAGGDQYGPNADRAVPGAVWWLRSPSGVHRSAAYVYDNGSVDISVGGLLVINTFAVRPAIKINLSFSDGTIAVRAENESETAERVAGGVILDLRSMKAACLLLYFDRMDEFENKTVTNVTPEMIAIYLDHPDKFQSDESPYLTEITDEGKWWVGFDLKKAGTEDAVKEYLRERAESVGLCGAMDADVLYADQDVVWLMAQ